MLGGRGPPRGAGGGRAAASPPALRMPGARTCSLAARRGLPWAVAAEALAEPPQGPEPRVPGWVGARSAGERGGGGHTGRDERRARGRAGPDRTGPAGARGKEGVTAAAIRRPALAERRRGSATWPRAAGSTLPAREGAEGNRGRHPAGAPGRADSLGSAVPPKSATFPETPKISAVETNDPFAEAGILAAARRVPGSPEESLPSPSVTLLSALR